MTASAETTLFWVEKIIAIGIVFQTIEIIQIRRTFDQNGIWNWNTLQKDYENLPNCVQRTLSFFLKHPNFIYLNFLRLISGLALGILSFSNPMETLLLGTLLFTSFLISLRWRGTFNGGSDSMTLIVLTALFLARLFGNDPRAVEKCLWYLAIQCCLSYFLGGLGKLQNPRWRKGKAVFDFIQFLPYSIPQRLKGLSERSLLLHFAAWGTIVFECCFPLAFSNPEICILLMGVAFLFHLGNVYTFGLNRFLFSWSATYPALYYCSKTLF